MQDPLIGRNVGKYRVLSRLGEGGMSDLYLAQHQMLGSKVALKVLPAELAEQPRAEQRFLSEARLASQLRHPHIIPIHDVGSEDGVIYLAMDLVGGTLADLLAARGRLPENEVLELSRQVLSALAHAHAQGVVHRDLKPENILLDQQGQALVSDFGIAAAALAGEETPGAGSALYLSPEQAAGGPADTRSDLYSWGAVMYQLLTGRPPFGGQGRRELARQHREEAPMPPAHVWPQISPDLNQLIMRALAKDPAQRFGSAREMLKALEELAAGGAGQSPLGPTLEPERPGLPLVGLLVGGLIFLAGLALAAWLILGRNGP